MTVEVAMPQIGESIAEGTLVKWHKRVGDAVKRDETLFEITTDKTDSEVYAPQDGYLAKVLVNEGETVPVNTVVCLLQDTPLGAEPRQEAGAAAQPQPAREAVVQRQAPQAKAPEAAPPSDPAGHKTSPLVRRLAGEHGIDLTTLKGSGAKGRVTKEDILAAIEARQSSAPGTDAAAAIAEDRLEPMSPRRAAIAEHMILSRKTSAHVTSVFEVDMSPVRALKDSLGPVYLERHKVKLTYLPFIVQATARTLRKFPALNAAIEGKNVHYHGEINIGIAVALEDGLIVPVIKNADQKALPELARAIADLAERARKKRLRHEESQGGTFTITNPGVFGSLIGTPIINQPQVAILCLGAVVKRPVVLPGTDAIAVRSMAYISISFDHRLIDGAVADQFLAQVKSTLEGASFVT